MVAPSVAALEMASWFHIHGWSDFFRYVIAMEGVILAGVNLALIIHAPSIFSHSTCKFWRLVLIGKTAITVALSLVLLSRTDSQIGWRTCLAAIGYTVTLVAIWMLYENRPFRPHKISELEASRSETEIVAARVKN